ncbi:phospholipase D/nuclease [Trametes gibbosa]|nr:phospholipase D/nuclease [Trametes gibbosa]
MDDELHADIAKAIALSMQETERASPQNVASSNVIDVDADDDHDEEARFQAELQQAIEASIRERGEAKQASRSVTQASTKDSMTPAASSSAASFLSERAQLERERLARQKRLRPEIYSGTDQNAGQSDGDIEELLHDPKRQRVSSSSGVGTRRANASRSILSSTATTSTAAPSRAAGPSSKKPPPQSGVTAARNLFFDGELRQTANKHVDPLKDRRPVFRLSEILAPKDEIQFAIVSAFCWTYPWIYAMFSPNTPVIAVDHDPRGQTTLKAILPNWVRTTPFLRNGFGCMHMKFMLLFYKDGRLRVVVSTANLVEYDWRDIENSVWLQDIPKQVSPVTPPLANAEDFSSAIIRVLHALNVAPALVNLLKNDHPNLPIQRLEDIRSHWDFSRVKAALVPSIAGKHEGWPKAILTGHTRLMKALIDIQATLPQDKDLALECQGSSIGNYSSIWVNEIYRSAKGESTQSWLEMPRNRRAKVPYPAIKILFPTARYVQESVLGEPGGGTMFCRRKQWEATNFPRELFHQTRSKRGRVLMHSKMILATFVDKKGSLERNQRKTTANSSSSEDNNDSAEKCVGWVYVGSHNFTPSAWGTLSGSGFNPTLNIHNYELGVVIPLHDQDEIDRAACWERPPQKYVAGLDMPWMQTESPYFVEDA